MPDAAADEQRVGAAAAGGVEAAPERPERPEPARRRAARTAACVPGPTSSSRNWASPSAPARDRERARQVRALVLSPAPALGGREHRELARGRSAREPRGPSGSATAGRGRRQLARGGDAQHAGGDGAALTPRPAPSGLRRRSAAARRATGGRRQRRPAVQLLQAQHLRLAVAVRAGDRARGGDAGRERGQAGDAVGDRGAADLPAVAARAGAGGRVDHEVDVAALDPVDHVRGALADLVEPPARARPCARSPRRCRAWRRSRKPLVVQALRRPRRRRLVGVGDRDEGRALAAAAARRRPPGPWRTRSGSRARCPSPRRSSASPGRAARRSPRSGRTAARPP